MKLILHYFELPGKAETTRLILTVGGIEFTDHRFTREEWPELKPKTPFGQVPALEVDGKMLAQSAAIERYAAKLAGLYPEDPWLAALADQAYFQTDDAYMALVSTRSSDKEELIKLRQEALAGPFKSKLQALERLLEQSSSGYFAGDKLSYADIHVYSGLSFLASGFFDGIPANFLDEYPKLKALRNKVANVPAIKAFYEKETSPLRATYKPDA